MTGNTREPDVEGVRFSAGAPLATPITARLGDRAWRDAIDVGGQPFTPSTGVTPVNIGDYEGKPTVHLTVPVDAADVAGFSYLEPMLGQCSSTPAFDRRV